MIKTTLEVFLMRKLKIP